jgi:predicted HNH restriction endonuclease
MELVSEYDQIIDNAQLLTDAIHNGDLDHDEASELVARGRVFLPFRYGSSLVFAPAKFIGYADNSVSAYRDTVKVRSGSHARKAITRVFGFDAVEDEQLELQLSNYCEQLGVRLRENKHSFWLTKTARRAIRNDRSAIDDVDADFGNDDPEYRKRMAGSYVRDQRIRKKVLERADGHCEYCGLQGFIARNGEPFLEAHHIVSLSEQGPDKMSNVIALCPTDHRRAHFDAEWESLQAQFSKILISKV